MIHIITGDGKGKTTSAAGLSVRAAGQGLKVLFIQFLKDGSSGEISILKNIPEIEVLHADVCYGFTFKMTDEQKKETARAYEKLIEEAVSSDAQLIILDEAMSALENGLINREQLEGVFRKAKDTDKNTDIITGKKAEAESEVITENETGIKTDIVLTGRGAPGWLKETADYVSEIKKIRHPFDKGVRARKGIEF